MWEGGELNEAKEGGFRRKADDIVTYLGLARAKDVVVQHPEDEYGGRNVKHLAARDK